ncbi:DUF4256 domain-containing protein [Acidaminobacter sp. JC074]|uniref:DUF4256 domain-containing protein n=1 Tax=Acidaminobacter sp. JC074 TaxID=2530199 RepID=UPI001F0E1382|nr:DUF4256 domain-containing protein [Acidaminobacter sp. JC074]MCH4886225.1 DUF4256 domain-containing protein [Acidaminobacter sp. JC074]
MASYEGLLGILKERFEKNKDHYPEIAWSDIEKRLLDNLDKVWSLQEMESSGGQPSFVYYEASSDKYVFFDCSKESPKGRRSICYDHEALEARKKHKPKDSAIHMAEVMKIDILSEKDYKRLQDMGDYDTKTSSWIQTPDSIRSLGGALYCDNRYKTVFTYHNGADAYFSDRGFRGALKL